MLSYFCSSNFDAHPLHSPIAAGKSAPGAESIRFFVTESPLDCRGFASALQQKQQLIRQSSAMFRSTGTIVNVHTWPIVMHNCSLCFVNRWDHFNWIWMDMMVPECSIWFQDSLRNWLQDSTYSEQLVCAAVSGWSILVWGTVWHNVPTNVPSVRGRPPLPRLRWLKVPQLAKAHNSGIVRVGAIHCS